MVAPNDPRDRLPPLLRRYCPDSETIKRWLRVGEALTFLTRFARACACGWSAVDWPGRAFLVCAAGVVLLVAIRPTIALWGFVVVALVVFGSRAWRWRELDRKERVFVIGSNIAAVVALALAIAGPSDRKPQLAVPPAPAKPDTADAKEADYRRRAEKIVRDAGITDATEHQKRVDEIVRMMQPLDDDGIGVHDPRMVEAYLMQQRFVTRQRFALSGVNYVDGPEKLQFSPFTETKIVRDGHFFRVRGWWVWVHDDKPIKDTHHWHYICEMRFDEGLDVWHLSNVELIMP